MRRVLAAVCCGFVATAVAGFVGDAARLDPPVTIVSAIVIGLLVMLTAALLLDEKPPGRHGPR